MNKQAIEPQQAMPATLVTDPDRLEHMAYAENPIRETEAREIGRIAAGIGDKFDEKQAKQHIDNVKYLADWSANVVSGEAGKEYDKAKTTQDEADKLA